jgi:chromosome segregation ATPase
MVATDRSKNVSLEDEVQMLRRKVTSLTKAGFQMDELKQELSKTRQEKLSLEHNFMNQISSISQASALKNEELEVRLKESEKVNKELARQLQVLVTPEEVEIKIEDIEMRHRKELAHVIDKNQDDIASMQKELSKAHERKDTLASELSKIKKDLVSKENEIEYLELEIKTLHRNLAGDNTNLVEEYRIQLQSANDQANELKQKVWDHEKEIDQLKEKVYQLEKELDEKTQSHQREIETMQAQLATFQSELEEKAKVVSKLTSDLDVGRGTSERMSIQLIENQDKLQSTLLELKRTHELLENERKQLDVERQVARRKFEALEQQVASLKNANPDAAASIENQQQNSDNVAALKKLQKEMDDMVTEKSKLTTLNQELTNKAQALEIENSKILATSTDKLQNEVSQLRQQNHELSSLNDDLSKKIHSLEDEVKTLKSNNHTLEVKQDDLLRLNKALENEKQALKKSNSKLCNEKHNLEEELREAKKAKMTQLVPTLLPTDVDSTQANRSPSSGPASPAKSAKSTRSLISERRSMFETRVQNLEQKVRVDSKPQEQIKTAPKAPLIEKLRSENEALDKEVKDLKKKLSKEQEVTASFRRELSELKVVNARPSSPLRPISPSKVSFGNTASPRFNNGGKSPTATSFVKSSVAKEFTGSSVSDFTEKLKSARQASVENLGERRASTGSRAEASQIVRHQAPTALRASMSSPKNESPAKNQRMPVRGLVQTFEKRISQMSNRPAGLDALRVDPPLILQSQSNTTEVSGLSQSLVTLDIEEMTELRKKLYVEREQVEELETELTRQCDINCILLNEINVLTDQVESSREKEAERFREKDEYMSKIEKLNNEIKQLQAEEVKAIEQDQSEADRKELLRLQSEIKVLREQLSASEAEKATIFSKMSRDEQSHKEKVAAMESKLIHAEEVRKEIDRVQAEINGLQAKLAQADREKDKLVLELSSQEAAYKDQVQRMELQILDLEREVTVTKKEAKMHQEKNYSVSDEATRLSSQIVTLKAQLSDAEEVRKHLTAEFESSTESDKAYIEQLRKENDDLRKTLSDRDDDTASLSQASDELDTLRKRLSQLDTELSQAKSALEHHQKNEEEITRLENLVKELRVKKTEAEVRIENIEAEFTQRQVANEEEIERLKEGLTATRASLAQVTEQRDQLESRDQELQDNFDRLRMQVDGKVEEFEKTHEADKELIETLRVQLSNLEVELKQTLEQNEDLRCALEAKHEEGLLLSSSNQKSSSTEIERLRKNLADSQASRLDLETEYKQKVNELQDMVESLQAELDQGSEASSEEVQELKETIEHQETQISQLLREKEQLVLSMNDMTSSRRDEIDELQSELMEMSTRAANQTREVEKLKQQLQENGYRKEEMERLRSKLREMQKNPAGIGGVSNDESIAHALENVELRQKLRETTLARKIAEEKLKEVDSSKGESKTVQVLRERNTALKFEIEKLSRKLKKMSVLVEKSREQKRRSSQNEEVTRLAI